MFFTYNEALVPPYRVLVDTNFINLSLENRIDLVKAMMDALYAKGEHTKQAQHTHAILGRVSRSRAFWRAQIRLTETLTRRHSRHPAYQPSLASLTASSQSWKNLVTSTAWL